MHEEGERITQFYKRFDSNVAHLKNPDLGQIVEAFERLNRRKQMVDQETAVLFTYIGHGIEKGGSIHAALTFDEIQRDTFDLSD